MVPSHRCDGCRDGPSGEWSTVSIYSHVCYLLPVYSLSPFPLLCFGISLAVSGHRGWAVTSSGPQTFSFRVEINVLYQQRLFQAQFCVLHCCLHSSQQQQQEKETRLVQTL